MAAAVFISAYVLIVLERIDRTVVAMTGAALVMVLGVISQEQAFAAIDWNTLGLLIGMMIIVGITRQSGVFEYVAVKSAKMAGGQPLTIMVVLSFVTALLSAFLDNVTTVLLIVPVTFAITDHLKVSPMPFLFAEIIASNIGGTATLIGDPPNIMIGSATGLGFLDFIVNLGLPVLIILLVTLAVMVLWFRKELVTGREEIQAVMEMKEHELIKDWQLMKQSLVVLGLVIVLFFLHQALHLESATVALLGAAVLMLVSREEPEEILLTVEWPTIFFFAGLFIMVGGLEHTGIIEGLARKSLQVTGGNVVTTGILVLWMSAIASAFVDNIPFVAAMIPLLQAMGSQVGTAMESIWWALALGACLGGNGTLIGASANVIVAGIADKYGSPIRFVDYLKVGFPLMILSIILSTVYLMLFYWR